MLRFTSTVSNSASSVKNGATFLYRMAKNCVTGQTASSERSIEEIEASLENRLDENLLDADERESAEPGKIRRTLNGALYIITATAHYGFSKVQGIVNRVIGERDHTEYTELTEIVVREHETTDGNLHQTSHASDPSLAPQPPPMITLANLPTSQTQPGCDPMIASELFVSAVEEHPLSERPPI